VQKNIWKIDKVLDIRIETISRAEDRKTLALLKAILNATNISNGS